MGQVSQHISLCMFALQIVNTFLYNRWSAKYCSRWLLDISSNQQSLLFVNSSCLFSNCCYFPWSVCWPFQWALQKQMNHQDATLGTDSPKEPYIRWGAHWRHLVNMFERSVPYVKLLLPLFYLLVLKNSTPVVFLKFWHYQIYGPIPVIFLLLVVKIPQCVMHIL